jgi:hypothetical protein
MDLARSNIELRETMVGVYEATTEARNSVGEFADTTRDAAMSTEDFEQRMGFLSDIIGGELGDAQEDYNAKIAEYKQQLDEARTAEEKLGIQEKIDAETAAYNERAKSIMFNIQQQAILAGVEAGTIDPSQATAALGALAQSYGLIDEAQRNAMNQSSNLVALWASGAITTQQLVAGMEGINAQFQEFPANAAGVSEATEGIVDPLQHVKGRSIDAKVAMLELNEAQAALGEGIRKDASPAASGLAQQLGSLPPDGTAWRYLFDITVTGRVPRLPKLPGQDDTPVMLASGGQIPQGYGAFVGDAPGGGMTPYTEYITPGGYVFNAAETRRMVAAGLIDPRRARKLAGGSALPIIDPPVSWMPAPKPPPSKGYKPPPGTSTPAPGTPITSPEEDAAEMAVAGVASQVTTTVQNGIMGALVPAQNIAISASVQNNTTLKEIRNLLAQLVDVTPRARDELANAQFYSSLGS